MVRIHLKLSNLARLHLGRDVLRDGRWIGLQQDGRWRVSAVPVPASAWSALTGQSRCLPESGAFKVEVGEIIVCVDPASDVLTVIWEDRRLTGSVSQLRRVLRSLESMPQGPFRFASSANARPDFSRRIVTADA